MRGQARFGGRKFVEATGDRPILARAPMRRDWGHLMRFMPALLGTLALALPAGAVAAEAETGTISGRATDELGLPMEAVDVCAETVDETWFICDTTGTDGTYRLTGLPAGRYKVGFWAKGNFITQFWERELTWNMATPIDVAPGISIAEIDATIERGATISGLVTERATGAPVAGVLVCASVGELERCAKTNALGLYAIVGLAERTWTVEFYPEKTEAALMSQPYSGGPITMAAQETKPGVNAELVAGGQIAGTVRARERAPRSGASSSARRPRPRRSRSPACTRRRRAPTASPASGRARSRSSSRPNRAPCRPSGGTAARPSKRRRRSRSCRR